MYIKQKVIFTCGIIKKINTNRAMKRFIAHNQRIKVKNDATLEPNRPTLWQIIILIVLE